MPYARPVSQLAPDADADATSRDEALQRFRIAVDATTDAIFLVDPERMAIVELNDAADRMLGYTRAELLTLPLDRVFGSRTDDLRRSWRELTAAAGMTDAYQTTHQRKDGSRVEVEVRRRAVRVGQTMIIVKVARDLTAQKAAERLARQNAEQQGLIAAFGQFALQNAELNDVMAEAVRVVRKGQPCDQCRLLDTGTEDDLLTVRAAAGWDEIWGRRITFSAVEETEDRFIIGAREVIVVDDFLQQRRYARSQLLVAHDVRSAVEVLVVGVDGPYCLLGAYARTPGRFDRTSANFMKSLAHTLAAAIDRKNAEAKIARMAQFDALTGLPNRVLLLDRLWQAIAHAEREQVSVGVLFVDIDRFKIVNDTLGHEAGDQLLVEVARRLHGAVRQDDTVARMGGDEFALVLPYVLLPEDFARVAAKVVAALAQPFQICGESVYVSASVGVSSYPRNGTDPNTLLKKADSAMYRAKDNGRNNFQWYQAEPASSDRLRTEALLRGALERNEFLLHYQPKIDLATGTVCGFEALLRWRHPEKGLVPPHAFVAILEDTGLIVPVGAWIIGHVCAQLQAWQAEGAVVRPVAVNLSARQFRQKDIDVVIERALVEHGLDAELLELELTESILTNDSVATVLALENMKAIGLRISIDDFGTGHSSLAYLRRFPLDVLKIDREFVRGIESDPDDAAIAAAIIGLAHSLKLKVVAEGVESAGQLAFLRAHGCDEVQGFYFSRPLPAAECARVLREGLRPLSIEPAGDPQASASRGHASS